MMTLIGCDFDSLLDYKWRSALKYNEEKIDEAVLALLYLNADKNYNTWKGFDWQSMNRLHDQGLITNPVSKAKSVHLTEEGFNKAKELFEKLFCG